jgi:hypothetical protein
MIVLLLAGLLVVPATTALAGGESQVFYWDDAAGWVGYEPGDPDALARLFRTGDFVFDSCNAGYWEIPVHIRASIAQWVKFRLDWNTWEWFVRKPGCYAGNSIEAVVWSNGDIEVGYFDFGKLMPVLPENEDHNPVDIYYSYGESVGEAEQNGWVPAELLNENKTMIYDVGPDWELHYGIAWKLWSKICVDVCNSACDYYDDAFITITLKQQKPWIVFDTGEWGI